MYPLLYPLLYLVCTPHAGCCMHAVPHAAPPVVPRTFPHDLHHASCIPLFHVHPMLYPILHPIRSALAALQPCSCTVWVTRWDKEWNIAWGTTRLQPCCTHVILLVVPHAVSHALSQVVTHTVHHPVPLAALPGFKLSVYPCCIPCYMLSCMLFVCASVCCTSLCPNQPMLHHVLYPTLHSVVHSTLCFIPTCTPHCNPTCTPPCNLQTVTWGSALHAVFYPNRTPYAGTLYITDSCRLVSSWRAHPLLLLLSDFSVRLYATGNQLLLLSGQVMHHQCTFTGVAQECTPMVDLAP